MTKTSLFTIVLTLLVAGCSHNPAFKKLETIDQLIAAEQNDSAYNELLSIDEKSIKATEDRAHYNLLKTQTSYMVDKPLGDDSLLDAAIAYYRRNDNKQRLADAYYYKGVGLYRQNDLLQAMSYYKKAESLSRQAGDKRQQYKIAEGISYLNIRSGKYEMAFDYAKRALKLSESIGNKRWLADAYFRVGISFSELGLQDSAVCYFNKIEPYIKYVRTNDLPYFLANLGLAYMDTNPEKAKAILQEALAHKELTRPLEMLAEIAYEEGNQEKAYALWKRALAANDQIPKDNVIHNLIDYDIEHGKISDISEEVNEIIAIKDSIINKVKNDTIKDLQTRFDHQVEMNAAYEQRIKWQWALGAFALLTLSMTGYIVWRRNKAKQQETNHRLQIETLSGQILEFQLAKAEAEAQIAQLKQKQTDLQEEDRVKLEKLEKAKDNAQRNAAELEKKLSRWLHHEEDKIRRGIMLYEQIVKNENVHAWISKDYDAFITYYEASNFNAMRRIRRENGDITRRSLFYLILEDMGKNREDIAYILSINTESIRSLKFRINKAKESKAQKDGVAPTED